MLRHVCREMSKPGQYETIHQPLWKQEVWIHDQKEQSGNQKAKNILKVISVHPTGTINIFADFQRGFT